MFKLRMNKRGQSIFEYAIVIGVVGLALAAMQVYLRRGIQCGIKIAADELALQEDSVEYNRLQALNIGTTLQSNSRTNSTRFRRHGEEAPGGVDDLRLGESTAVTVLEPNRTWSMWGER